MDSSYHLMKNYFLYTSKMTLRCQIKQIYDFSRVSEKEITKYINKKKMRKEEKSENKWNVGFVIFSHFSLDNRHITQRKVEMLKIHYVKRCWGDKVRFSLIFFLNFRLFELLFFPMSFTNNMFVFLNSIAAEKNYMHVVKIHPRSLIYRLPNYKLDTHD